MTLMRAGMRKPSMAALIGLLLVLLPLLAVLQYRWLTEVSAGEQVQMQIHLRAAAEEFAGAFDRELTRAFLIFQADQREARPDQPGAQAAAAAQSWRLWRTTAPHPELVRALDLVEAEAPGQVQLLRFDPRQGRFVKIDWPPALTGWRDRLTAGWRQPHPGPPLPESVTVDSSGAAVMPIFVVPVAMAAESFPAGRRSQAERPRIGVPTNFVHGAGKRGAKLRGKAALPPPPKPFAPGRRIELRGPKPFPQRLLLVELNLPWLRKTFLPQLAERAFAANGAADYQVTIVSPAEPAHPVFRWGPQPDRSARISPPDLSIPMFRVRVADFVAIRERPRRVLPGGVEVGPPGPRVGKDLRVYRAIGTEPGPRFHVFFPAADFPGRWELQVRHRAGSLAAAVARIRRRNLGISGGILLLLLAGVGMMMQLAHKTERLAQQQMEFVAGVSHELRTPLAVIGSAAANLSDGVVREPAQVERYGALIAHEGRRLNAMVEQILEFASPQYRPRPLPTQPVAVAALVREAVEAAQPALAESGMRVECACSDEAPRAQADPASLRRCLDNLIGNAVKYAAEAGWIGIRTEHDAEALRLIVEDRGPGIEARDLPHLFDPFYRGRLAHERQIHGNGLGLALVQRLMQAQGGRVTVQTRAGHGTSFTLHLPLAPAGGGQAVLS